MAGRKIGFHGEARKFVPRANELAIVATIDAIAEGLAKLDGNRAAELDGEIGNAAARIEFVGSDDGLRGTNVETGLTAPAVIGGRRVAGQGEIGEDFAEKEPGSGGAMNQVGMFADPPESSVASEGFFENGSAVDQGAVAARIDRHC